MSPASPVSSRGRAERRGILVAFVVFGLFWGAWAAVLPAVQVAVSAGDGQLGLALGAVAVAALPAMPWAGRSLDRQGAARALPLSLLAFAVTVPLAAVASTLTVLVGALVLLGVATGALDVVVNATTAGWEREQRGALMSTAHGVFSLGVLAGSVGAGIARELGSGPLPVLLTIAVLVAAAALAQPDHRRPGPPAEVATGRREVRTLLVWLGVLTAGAFLAEDALSSWSALQLEQGLHASPAVSGLGPGVFAAAMAVGRLSGSALGRRLRDDTLLLLGSLALTAGALVLALAHRPGVALGGLVVAGAGLSVLAPVLYSAVGRRAAPGRQGADLAYVTSLGYAGFVAGPPLVGVLSAATSLRTALGMLSGVGLLLALAGPRVLRERPATPVGSGAAVHPRHLGG